MIEGWGFNPPPYWPKPPGDWIPPVGWRPDPAWGPVPPGWQLWIPNPRLRRRRKAALSAVGLTPLLALAVVAIVMPRAEGPRPGDPRAAAAVIVTPRLPALIGSSSTSAPIGTGTPAAGTPAAGVSGSPLAEVSGSTARTAASKVPSGVVAATTTLAPAVIRRFRTCGELNRVYPNGIGMPEAVDRTTGVAVTRFGRSTTIYRLNLRHDRDGDGIACEPVP